eukprot:6178261-Lingulodinium_polyedra.AAC.1
MPAWGGDWLLWVRSSRTNGAWWYWCDSCYCFADPGHAASARHLNKLAWYVPSALTDAEATGAVADDDVGAPWATSADSPAIARPARPKPPPR